MAYYSKKDIVDVTFNSTDLKAFLVGISGLKRASVMEEFFPAGSAYKTRAATGMYETDPVVIEFVYDGGASGPNVKCAQDTSATLTVTFVSGQSITGTAIVTETEVVISDDKDNHLMVTLQWTGTVTYDFAA
jgi:hypothetical protein